MPLHEVLVARRDEVLARWREIVQKEIAPDTVSTIELIDHMPKYLDEVIAALVVATSSRTGDLIENQATAAGHGEQRLRLGFSLDAVVREYGAMRDAIVETARATGAPITYDELHSIFSSTISGISHAISEYSFQRDAELHRQHNEHIAFIAHELRNPLATAVTAGEMLAARGVALTSDRAYTALTRSLTRMAELVDHSLNAARQSAGVVLERVPTRLSAILDDAHQAVVAAAESKQIELAVVAESDADVVVDVRLIRSALTNVLHNAVKYTKAGGHIAMRGRVTGAHFTVEVEDGCGGIPPGSLDLLFAPFVRRNTKEPGFGLGLAIAKQAVDAHGGTIRVQNMPEAGCMFVIEIPLGT